MTLWQHYTTGTGQKLNEVAGLQISEKLIIPLNSVKLSIHSA